jgi:hypothetical protein
MFMMRKILAGGAGLAALAAAAPAAAQYYPYGYNSYNYNPYAYSRGDGYGYANTSFATQQCTAAVQNRLYTRTGLGGIIGSLIGVSSASPRVLSISRVTPNRTYVRVRGYATSGRMAYNPYGVGYYGALGANYAADLSFKCDVDYRGRVRDIDINRR